MKTLLILATLIAAFTASAQANSWGFSLGNGAGFYWGNQPRTPVYAAPAYVAPAPVYYERPVVYSASSASRKTALPRPAKASQPTG